MSRPAFLYPQYHGISAVICIQLTPEWTMQIGADGYGKTAVHASQLLEKLIKGGEAPPVSKPVIIES